MCSSARDTRCHLLEPKRNRRRVLPNAVQRAPDAKQPATNGRPANGTPRAQTDSGATATPSGNPSAADKAQLASNHAAAPRSPFVLTESQQKLLDQILANWEQHSDKVKNFRCDFTRWDYDPAFGAANLRNLKAEGKGFIKYKSPDCGEYSVVKLDEWDPGKKTLVAKTTTLDHWTCDGKAIYEFNADKRQLIERRLPPEMQGKAITDGPLPFIFGANALQLKRRYWLRDVTPKEDIGKKVWLEAVPKFQQDQINFLTATVILNESDFLPYALQITLPDGKSKTAYEFVNPKVNSLLEEAKDFLAPRKPFGWEKIVEDAAPDSPQTTPPPVEDQPQAKRPGAAAKRK